MTELPDRKPTHWRYYDYSRSGRYFITICTHEKKHILSKIVGQGLAPATVSLTVFGEIAQEQLLCLSDGFPMVKIDKYVIMPNHIHAIVELENPAGASPCPTLSDVVCAFKSLTVRTCRKKHDIDRVFQTSFHDHIIRNRDDYANIWRYIDTNPQRWKKDCYYEEN